LLSDASLFKIDTQLAARFGLGFSARVGLTEKPGRRVPTYDTLFGGYPMKLRWTSLALDGFT